MSEVVVDQDGGYFRFCSMKRLGSIFTPPRIGCLSIAGLTLAVKLPVPIYILGFKLRCKVSSRI